MRILVRFFSKTRGGKERKREKRKREEEERERKDIFVVDGRGGRKKGGGSFGADA